MAIFGVLGENIVRVIRGDRRAVEKAASVEEGVARQLTSREQQILELIKVIDAHLNLCSGHLARLSDQVHRLCRSVSLGFSEIERLRNILFFQYKKMSRKRFENMAERYSLSSFDDLEKVVSPEAHYRVSREAFIRLLTVSFRHRTHNESTPILSLYDRKERELCDYLYWCLYEEIILTVLLKLHSMHEKHVNSFIQDLKAEGKATHKAMANVVAYKEHWEKREF